MQVPQDGQIVVVGAVNMDLSGTPAGPLRSGDSNPGRITLSAGGVGRNIAENLRRLGRNVSLVTLTGDDHYGRIIREQCRNLGIRMEMSMTEPQCSTSSYLCINERNGDLHTAVSDMAIYERLTPARLEPFLPALNSAALVILDANLPEDTIAWAARNIRAPLAADPVSAGKVSRLKSCLSRLVLMKPNIPEAEILTGIRVRSEADWPRAAEALLNSGVRRVYLSLGPRGVYADDGNMRAVLPCHPGMVRNTTGCGDAFFAAAADAWLEGLDTLEAAQRALAAAAWCAADEHAVSPTLNKEILIKSCERVKEVAP